MTTQLGIALFPGASLGDFVPPLSVLSVAPRAFEIVLLSSSTEPTRVEVDVRVLPQGRFHDAGPLDVIWIPGGTGALEGPNLELVAFVTEQPPTTLLASTGAGTCLLAQLGLLDRRAASRPLDPVAAESMARLAPTCRLLGARLVEDGRLITAAGGVASLELALHLIRRHGVSELELDRIATALGYGRAYRYHRDDLRVVAPLPAGGRR